MHFLPVRGTLPDDAVLTDAYKAGHAVGVLRMGNDHLFFRAGLKYYAIPYTDITRCFRRVMQVPARMCCGKGNFQIENLVVCGAADAAPDSSTDAADGRNADRTAEVELAQIQLPGVKAARLLMEELKEKIPHAAFSAPAPEPEKAHHARHNKAEAAAEAAGAKAHGKGGRS